MNNSSYSRELQEKWVTQNTVDSDGPEVISNERRSVEESRCDGQFTSIAVVESELRARDIVERK